MNLKHLTHYAGSGTTTVLADYAYSYDAANWLGSETDSFSGPPVTTNYGYDADGQLTTAGPPTASTTYNYTTKGNRQSVVTGTQTQTYTPGQDNRPVSDGIWNYSFDAEGNVTQKTGVSNPNDIWVYGYDFRNLMTSATHTLNGITTVQETDKYDVFGHRVELQVSINGGAPTTQKFAYDGQDIWADLDASKALTMRRLYVDGQVAARIDTSNTVAFYLPDHLGSIRDLMNGSIPSQVIDHIDYDAFGNITNETAQGSGDRYKYAGYQWDASVSLYSVQARWYDPATGRWTSEDPLGFAAGDDNLNRYVGNAPTNATDPSGEVQELLGVPADDGRLNLYAVENGRPTFWEALGGPVTLGLAAWRRQQNAGTRTYIGYINPRLNNQAVWRDDVKGYVPLSAVQEAISDEAIRDGWFKANVDRHPEQGEHTAAWYMQNPARLGIDPADIELAKGINMGAILARLKEEGRWAVDEIKGDYLIGPLIPAIIAGAKIGLTLPRLNAKHIFYGEIRGGVAKGFHHVGPVPEGKQALARVGKVLRGPNKLGVYEARVQVFDRALNKWVAKGPKSTFFPDAWSRQQVVTEIYEAYWDALTKGKINARGAWTGQSSSGLTIQGYLRGGTVDSAYSIYQP